MTLPKPQLTLKEYTDRFLDVQYNKVAGPMLAQIRVISSAPNSQMQKAISDLQQEAFRLEQDEKPITQDNPALKQALLAYGAVLTTASTLIKANDNAIQATGQLTAIPSVTSKVFSAVTSAILQNGLDPLSPQAQAIYAKAIKNSGAKWIMPKNSVDFAADFVESDAWVAKMEGWGSGYANLTKNTLLQGMQNGWSPRYTADILSQHATNIPYSAAENLTRTLQLTSYREGSLAMESINGGFIIGKIRIATLDASTCLSCIALHGTPLEPGERVDDHYNGRCSEFYQVPGGDEFPAFMQADSTPGNRNFVPYQSGNDWFASLPDNRQRQQASFASTPAKFNAYKGGVALSEFVGHHDDDVFGHQFIEQSLKAIGQESYYVSNQTMP